MDGQEVNNANICYNYIMIEKIEKMIRNPAVVDDFMDNCFYGTNTQRDKTQGAPRVKWEWEDHTTSDMFPQFSHELIHRHSKRPTNGLFSDSPYWKFFRKIIKNFLEDNELEHKRITRANINCTYNFPYAHCSDPHVDYPSNHYTAILYLNNAVGSTYIFDKNANYKNLEEDSSKFIIPYKSIDWKNDPIPVKHEVKPEKGKMLLFDGSHYHAMCPTTPGDLRLIVVYNISY